MKTVKQDEFESFIRAIPPSALTNGRDVGRTHGIVCYYNDGKHVATESWVIIASARQFTYEVQQ